MAEALAKLPVRVLWRLSPQEIPDKAAIEALRLGNNTKVGLQIASIRSGCPVAVSCENEPSPTAGLACQLACVPHPALHKSSGENILQLTS